METTLTNTIIDFVTYIKYLIAKTFNYALLKGFASLLLVVYGFMFDVSLSQSLLALWVLMVLDFISGLAAAQMNGIPIQSRKIAHGAIKFLAYYGSIAGAHLAESGLSQAIGFIDESVIAFFLLTELISLLENVGKMGFSTPQRLLNQLKDYEKKL
jgi:toxin secretion/phage lysis holin